MLNEGSTKIHSAVQAPRRPLNRVHLPVSVFRAVLPYNHCERLVHNVFPDPPTPSTKKTVGPEYGPVLQHAPLSTRLLESGTHDRRPSVIEPS